MVWNNPWTAFPRAQFSKRPKWHLVSVERGSYNSLPLDEAEWVELLPPNTLAPGRVCKLRSYSDQIGWG